MEEDITMDKVTKNEFDSSFEEDMIIDDVIEDEETITNEVIEDEFDSSFEEQDSREILDNSYKNYENSYNELVAYLKTILINGEYTEEDKAKVSEINTDYDENYLELLKQIDTAKAKIENNKTLDLNSNILLNTQDEVFNALTKNGEVQAIYKDENGDIYINAQFLQTRGLRVVNDDNQTTLYIDNKGNLTTSGDIVGGTITGTILKALTIDTNEVDIQSNDGGMVLKGSLQQFKDKNGNVRIQIGKSENGDFSFVLYGSNGETVLIDENGIKQDAISAKMITAEKIASKTITAEQIATGTITASSGIIAEGAIGNAQISSVDAGKIDAGKIDTSKVEVAGADGHLKIKGNRLQVFNGIGSDAKERVSLGDVNGDGTIYGLRVRGADGETILLDENGITKEGITDGSITNDKISNDANIDGSKININSVITKINEDGTENINGTKIEVEGNTLTTKLSTITNKQTENSELIAQAQSNITANANAIKLKVDTQTYNTDKADIISNISKNTSSINMMKDEISLKVEQSDIDSAIGKVNTKLEEVELKVKDDSIISVVKSSTTNGKNTFIQQSDITQLDNSWTAKFNNGYKQGIVTMDSNGIIVTANNIKSKTTMSSDGFKITNTDTNEDVFKVNSNGNIEANKLIITDGSISIGTTANSEKAFVVKNNGNLKIGGTTGRTNTDGTSQGIFEVTSTGKLYSRNKDNANIYTILDDGTLTVRNKSTQVKIASDGIEIKNIDTENVLKMSDNGISTDLLTVSGKAVVNKGLRSTGYVRAGSLAVANKKFDRDIETINGSNQSILYLGHTMIIYGRTSFTGLTANSTKTNAITFDQEFTYAPVVMAIPNSTSPNQCGVGAGSVTTSGCNIYLNRTSATDTNVFWVAIGERASSENYTA